MKILCLFVRHGTGSYADALPILDAWYERHGLLAQRTLWIVDNALDPQSPPQALGPRTSLHAGDNSAWEFSAWARALQEVQRDSSRYDIVHFVTSAFNTLYTGYLEHFRPDMLFYTLSRHACLGHIDSYDRPIELGGATSASWIRTCFFFLPYEDAARIAPWAAFSDPRFFFKDAGTTEFRSDSPLSTDHQQRIRTWLEGNEVGGHTWHSPIAPRPGESERFQKKTLAIANEHHLSIVLRRQGIPLVDYCWLYTSGDAPGAHYPAPPAEAQQLRVRRQVLGIPEAPG
jgi:hypothetical protein